MGRGREGFRATQSGEKRKKWKVAMTGGTSWEANVEVGGGRRGQREYASQRAETE